MNASRKVLLVFPTFVWTLGKQHQYSLQCQLTNEINTWFFLRPELHPTRKSQFGGAKVTKMINHGTSIYSNVEGKHRYPVDCLKKLLRTWLFRRVYKWSGDPLWAILTLIMTNRSEPEQFWTMDAKKWMRQDACHIVPNSPGLFAIRNRPESFRTMFEWHGSKDIKEHEVSAMHLWYESGFWIFFGTVWNCVELSSASRNGPKVTQVFKFRCPSALLSCFCLILRVV